MTMAWSDEVTISRKSFFSCGVDSPQSKFGQGFNYTLEAFVRGPVDQTTGLVMNLTDLDEAMKLVVKTLDHHHLSKELDFFKGQPHTPERLAHYCFLQLSRALNVPSVRLEKLRIYEGLDRMVEVSRSTPEP